MRGGGGGSTASAAPKAARPKPEQKDIAFQPFDDFMELYALASMSPYRRAENAGDVMNAVGGAASSSSSGQQVPSVSSRAAVPDTQEYPEE